MAAIHEPERAFLELEEHVHMYAGRQRSVEPNQLAIQSKMKHYHAAIELPREILSAPLDSVNSCAAQSFVEQGRDLWTNHNAVNYSASANRLSRDQRAQGPGDGLHFGGFRHFLVASRFEPQSMSGRSLDGIIRET